MRGTKMIGILWIIIAVCLTAVLILKLKGSSAFSYNSTKQIEMEGDTSKLADSYTFSQDEFNMVDIKLVSENLVLDSSSDNKVHIEIYCPVNYKPSVKVFSNTLKIEAVHKTFQIHGFTKRQVIVKLPVGMDISDMDLNVVSGSLHIANINAENLDAACVSGSVHMNNCEFGKAEVKSTSGSVNISECNIDSLEGKSTSGSVRINGSYKQLELSSLSGSVTAEISNPLVYDSELKATSGSVRLKLPSDAGFISKYHCTSGTYHNNITGCSGKSGTETVNGGGPKIELQSSSGSIHIN